MSPRSVSLPLSSAFALALSLIGCPKETPKGEPSPAPSVSVAATASAKPLWDEAARTEAIAAGTATITKHQCTRCHTIDKLGTPARPLHCTSCHVFLKSMKPGDEQFTKLTKKYGEGILERYQRNIQHLQQLPDLTGIAKRVRPDWIATFLAEPYDLRPLLEESMIRHALEAPEIRNVVRYFAAVADAPDPYAPGFEKPSSNLGAPAKPSDDRVARGQQLFTQKGCTACHAFGNVGTDKKALESAKAAALLAPNLRYAKDRTRPDVLVDWIVDPKKLLPSTTMPPMGVTKEEAELLRDFLFHGDPKLKPLPVVAAPATPPAPKLLDRQVSWEETKERVLGKVCVHCHMNDYEKDPGPGNLGGLGYKGIKLQMRTYETLVSGAVLETGDRYSVLVPKKGETLAPILVAMLRRNVEATRDNVAAFDDHELPHYLGATPGMPMGLPPMTDEELSILATWIAQGCVGPAKITGVPGVFDGYLVPDGPLEGKANKGCELRPKSKVRPAWAKESEEAAAKPLSDKPADKPSGKAADKSTSKPK